MEAHTGSAVLVPNHLPGNTGRFVPGGTEVGSTITRWWEGILEVERGCFWEGEDRMGRIDWRWLWNQQQCI